MRDGAELGAALCLGEKLDQWNHIPTVSVREMAEQPTLSGTECIPSSGKAWSPVALPLPDRVFHYPSTA